MGSVCEHCGQETERYSLCTWCGLRLCPRCKSPKHHDCDKDPRRQEIASNAEAEPMESGSIMRDYIPREERPGYGPSDPDVGSDDDEGPGFVRQFVASLGHTAIVLVILGILIGGVIGGAVFMDNYVDDETVGDAIDGVVAELDSLGSDNDTADDDPGFLGNAALAGENIPTFDVNQVEQAFHQLLNEHRESEGVGVVSYNDSLARIGTDHSKDMAVNGYLAHENQNGLHPRDRVMNEVGFCNGVGENIAQTWWNRLLSSGETINTAEGLAEHLFDLWLNSDGHRENMEFERYRLHGLGLALTDDGALYATNVFCT